MISVLPLSVALLAALFVGQAAAQSKPAGILADIDLAASERTLWISESTGDFTTIVQRDGAGDFDLGRGLTRPIDRLLAADDDDVLAILRDGEIYRFRRGNAEATRERQLPVGGRPLDLAVQGERIYGVFPGAVFDALAAVEVSPASEPALTAESAERRNSGNNEGHATTRATLGPGDGPGIAVFDGWDWRALIRCPRGVPDSGLSRAALLIQRDRILLAWLDDGDLPHAATAPLEGAGGWISLKLPTTTANAIALTEANQTPVLVELSGPEPLAAWRLLGQGTAEAWRPAELQVSPIEHETKDLRYARAVGFSQHLALLCSDGNNAFVRFARVGEPATLTTLSISEVFAQRGMVVRTQQLVQIATYSVLMAIMILLLVFRRDSMLRPAALPPATALAFTFQRAAALAIDFAPITLICAGALGLPWLEAWSTLVRWGLNPDAENPLPPTHVLTWWVLSIVALTVYTALLELLWSRTPGKRLLGLQVISEQGVPAAAWQRIARNLLRLIELLPHFWIFALLTLVSPNRQRLGDIVARTIVIRPAATAPEKPEKSSTESDQN